MLFKRLTGCSSGCGKGKMAQHVEQALPGFLDEVFPVLLFCFHDVFLAVVGVETINDSMEKA